mgnify:CR=1 FL=1
MEENKIMLEANNIDVLFVVPKLFGTEETDKFRLIDAGTVDVNFHVLVLCW